MRQHAMVTADRAPSTKRGNYGARKQRDNIVEMDDSWTDASCLWTEDSTAHEPRRQQSRKRFAENETKDEAPACCNNKVSHDEYGSDNGSHSGTTSQTWTKQPHERKLPMDEGAGAHGEKGRCGTQVVCRSANKGPQTRPQLKRVPRAPCRAWNESEKKCARVTRTRVATGRRFVRQKESGRCSAKTAGAVSQA
ncbi:hypothetical protein B0H11DRAFT_2243061 [Mycena galericulata]|nr:hypothetical protein B0H11DRAFT_2243061 [Mycena galericulata]